MTPQRADLHCSLLSLAADILDGKYAVEPALIERTAHVLKQAEPATRYTPPASQFAVETAEERE